MNSFILFRKATGSTITAEDFRLQIISGLVGANRLKLDLGKRSESPRTENHFKVNIPRALRTDQAKHMPVHGSSRRCALCSTAKNPHRTR